MQVADVIASSAWLKSRRADCVGDEEDRRSMERMTRRWAIDRGRSLDVRAVTAVAAAPRNSVMIPRERRIVPLKRIAFSNISIDVVVHAGAALYLLVLRSF